MFERLLNSGGRLVIGQTRVRVEDVLGLVAGKMSVAEIVAVAPGLTEADVQACIAHDERLGIDFLGARK
jgi:uncharacterized protein (DUF433 family)